jgi:hypothetical protein
MEEEGLGDSAIDLLTPGYSSISSSHVRQHEKSFHASADVSVCAGAMARARTHTSGQGRTDGWRRQGTCGVRGGVHNMDGWGAPWVGGMQIGAASMSCLAVAYDWGFDALCCLSA